MKNKTWVLTKVMLKSGEGLGFKLKTKLQWLIFIAIVGTMVPLLLYGYLTFIAFLYGSLATINQAGVLLTWTLAINSLVIFIFGVIYITSSFYFANDIENYLPLPVKPRQIVGAKFLTTVLYEYLITAVIYLPLLIYYGINQGVGIVYYLYGLIIFALIPVLPLAFAAIIVMVIMRFTNLTRYKEILKIIGGIIAMALALGINIVMQRIAMTIEAEEITRLLETGNNSLADIVAGMFPTVRWAGQALLNYQVISGLINLLIFVGLSVVIYVGILYFSELVYLQGVIGLSESRSHRVVVEADLAKIVKQKPKVWSYTLNELRLLIRTPIYFLNCVLINLIWPVLLFFTMVLSQGSGEDQEMMEVIYEAFHSPEILGTVLGVVIAAFMFVGGSNGITATTISREGQTLFVKKYLPISYTEQITAKILSGLLLGYLGVVLIVISCVIMFKLPLFFGVIVLAIGWLPILLTAMTGILFDLYNPKLEWDSEQKAVKQNMNVVYNILLSAAMGAGMVFLAIKIEGLLLTVAVFAGILALLNIVLYRLVYTLGVKRFKQLEG